MAYTKNELGLIYQLDPQEARRRILQAAPATRTYGELAEALDISKSSLNRFVDGLGIRDQVTSILAGETPPAKKPPRLRLVHSAQTNADRGLLQVQRATVPVFGRNVSAAARYGYVQWVDGGWTLTQLGETRLAKLLGVL